MMDDKKITRRVFGQLTAGASFAGALGVGVGAWIGTEYIRFCPERLAWVF